MPHTPQTEYWVLLLHAPEQSTWYFPSAAPPTKKGHCCTRLNNVLGYTHPHETAKDPLPDIEKGSHNSKHISTSQTTLRI